MEGIPENAQEVADFLLDEVLHGIELRPEESAEILSYLNRQHEFLFGPHRTYFVLGSYETPFKYRLETAADELNSRYSAYCYLMAARPDPDLPDDFPVLKLKFYLHAIYADCIPLILEHNTGGALAEFGRVDRDVLFERTHLFPRGKDSRYENLDDHALPSKGSLEARAIELAYSAGEALESELESLVSDINADGSTVAELLDYVERELGGHVPPDYSGVLSDGFVHFERVDRCQSWTTEAELREEIKELP